MLVASSRVKILIDNGLSYRQLIARLAAVGETLDGLRGLFITHEHSDHVNGAGTLARKHGVPVYLTPETYAALPEAVGPLPHVEFFTAGDAIAVDGLVLQSFSVSHDAADPVSYVVECAGARLGIAADLGRADNLVRTRLAGAHALVLESNYCSELIRRSSYPLAVVQRIHGSRGHLSNEEMCSLLSELKHDGLRVVVIVHVSRENNTEDQARARAAQALRGHPARLVVARQDEPTPVFEIGL